MSAVMLALSIAIAGVWIGHAYVEGNGWVLANIVIWTVAAVMALVNVAEDWRK